MRRLALLPILLFSMAVQTHAASNVKSYPASLCYQSTGPENSLAISSLGNLSNDNSEASISVFCPVLIEENMAVSGLEVKVVLIDEDASGNGISCQLTGTQSGQQFTSRWGASVKSTGGSGLQELAASLMRNRQYDGAYGKANLSCLLPPASDASKVSLISYQVTELR